MERKGLWAWGKIMQFPFFSFRLGQISGKLARRNHQKYLVDPFSPSSPFFSFCHIHSPPYSWHSSYSGIIHFWYTSWLLLSQGLCIHCSLCLEYIWWGTLFSPLGLCSNISSLETPSWTHLLIRSQTPPALILFHPITTFCFCRKDLWV